VDGKFPAPLIPKIPASIGIHYSDEFKNYVYKEERKERKRWVIDIGEAQNGMFNALLPGMFEHIVKVEEFPDETAAVELILVPSVEDFQYTLPSETKITIYEVFIKYNIQAYKPDGTIVADWILPAYGKTPSGFMQSDEGALNQAIIVALRDAGASFTMNFAKVPEISAWLENR
jgi:hypothetical protein